MSRSTAELPRDPVLGREPGVEHVGGKHLDQVSSTRYG